MSHIVSIGPVRPQGSALRASVFFRLGVAAVVAAGLWALTGWAMGWWAGV
ncbi:hypothetical protein [Bordetella genomosp. 4]|nr:hypothetical protein [Bordetella genomosp. 4]